MATASLPILVYGPWGEFHDIHFLRTPEVGDTTEDGGRTYRVAAIEDAAGVVSVELEDA